MSRSFFIDFSIEISSLGNRTSIRKECFSFYTREAILPPEEHSDFPFFHCQCSVQRCVVLSVAICRFLCLYFRVSGNHFPTSGTPWRSMLAPRDHIGGPVVYRILPEFGLIWGLSYISFFLQEVRTFIFVLSLFPGIFLSIFESKFRRLGLPDRVCHASGIAKNGFSWKSCLMNLGIDLCFLEEIAFFSDATDHESGIWQRGFTGYLAPQNS